MSYTPNDTVLQAPPMVSTITEYTPAFDRWLRGATSAPASSTWYGTRGITFVPLYLPFSTTVQKLWWFNGVTLSGNVDCGIYNSASGMPTTLLMSTGTTVQAAPSTAVQAVTLSPGRPIAPGAYFLALTMDNTTGTTFRVNNNGVVFNEMGMFQQTPATFGLPSTASPVASTTNNLPVFGFSTVSLI